MTLSIMTTTQSYTVRDPKAEITVTAGWISGRIEGELFAAFHAVRDMPNVPDWNLYQHTGDVYKRLSQKTYRGRLGPFTARDCEVVAAAASYCLSQSPLPPYTTVEGLRVIRTLALAGIQRIAQIRGAVMN